LIKKKQGKLKIFKWRLKIAGKYIIMYNTPIKKEVIIMWPVAAGGFVD